MRPWDGTHNIPHNRNADLIFVAYNSRSQGSSTLNGTINGGPLTAPSQQEAAITETRQWENVEEDPVDTYWRALDGKIPRARDSRFCKHGANAMCDYCMPLEVRFQFNHAP
jgi:nuclear protein localization family protein 4